jgi:hypothetical protein
MGLKMTIMVSKVREGWFQDKVQFVATEDHEAVFQTLMGDKTFYCKSGDRFTLAMSKDDVWQAGDTAKNLGCLINISNQCKFNWYWS